MILSDEQNRAAQNFMMQHYDSCCTNDMDAARLLISVSLASSIGPSVKLTCPHCSASQDVTEIDNW